MFVASDMGGNPPFKLNRWNSLYIRQLSMFMDALPPIPGDEQNSTMWDAVVEKVKHLGTNHSELLDQFLDPEQYLDPSWQPHYDVESMVWVMWWFFLRAKTKTSTQASPKEKGTHAKMCIAMTTHEIKEGSIDERLVLILECHNTQTMKQIISDKHAPFAQMLYELTRFICIPWQGILCHHCSAIVGAEYIGHEFLRLILYRTFKELKNNKAVHAQKLSEHPMVISGYNFWPGSHSISKVKANNRNYSKLPGVGGSNLEAVPEEHKNQMSSASGSAPKGDQPMEITPINTAESVWRDLCANAAMDLRWHSSEYQTEKTAES